MLAEKKLEQTLHEIIEVLEHRYEPERVILFGSYAYGHPHPDSDLDLLIVKESRERPLDRRIAVRQLLRQINFQVPLTLLVLTPAELEQRLTIGDQFLKEVVTRGKEIYARHRPFRPN